MQHSISSSQFKTHCLKIIEDIYNTKESLIITKRGKPMAKIEPITKLSDDALLFNSMQDKASIVDKDIISPIDEIWEANK
jgi:antitoxin (DNA-binding transcriptional repressor) of toxin-antitoxin stability system